MTAAAASPQNRPRVRLPGARSGTRRRNAVLALTYVFLLLVAVALAVLLVGRLG